MVNPALPAADRDRPRQPRPYPAGHRRRQPRTDENRSLLPGRCAGPVPSKRHQDKPSGAVSTGVGTVQPDQALWRIATTRMRTDARTEAYVTRRTAEGKNKPEIIRCLKRYIARETYRLLTNPPPTPDCARLRNRRQHAALTTTRAAQALRTQPNRIPALETGRDHNHQPAYPIPEPAPNPPRTGNSPITDLTNIEASSCPRHTKPEKATPNPISRDVPTLG